MNRILLFISLLLGSTVAFAQNLPFTPQNVSYDSTMKNIWRPTQFVALGDKLIFRANKTSSVNDFVLCYYDSTNNKAYRVPDSILRGVNNITYLIPQVHDGKIYFSGSNNITNSLCSWNGTDTIKKVVTEGLITPMGSLQPPYTFVGDTLFFMGHNGTITPTQNGRLYKLNTQNNSIQNLTPSKTYYEGGLIVYKNKVYISELGVKGKPFSYYDPQNNSVSLVTVGINTNDTYSPFHMMVVGNYLFFTAHSSLRSDTHIYAYEEGVGIKWINTIKTAGSNIKGTFGTTLISYDSSLFFSAAVDSTVFTPTDLFSFNPYTNLTQLTKNINGKNGSKPRNFRVVNNKLYFQAEHYPDGTQIFQYDAANDTVLQLTAYGKQYYGFGPDNFIEWGSYMYFSTYQGISQSRWVDSNDMGRIPLYNLPIKPTTVAQKQMTTIATTLYPNPTSSTATLNVFLEKAQSIAIQLVDINGRVVYTNPATEYNNGQHTIVLPTQQLAKGMYLLQLSNEQGSILKSDKLIKQ
ncbi:MAG: T9SS type A sorting domain-containing protein [Flavipsychrobacter sp.]